MKPDASALLAQLVALERRARAAQTPAELGWLMVNETSELTPYRQAAFWRADNGQIQALSGLATPDRHAPFVVWLAAWMAEQAQRGENTACRNIGLSDAQNKQPHPMWAEHLPACALWVPLRLSSGELVGALALWRDQPWQPSECALLDTLAGAYAHAWTALSRQKNKRAVRAYGRRKWYWAAAALVLVMLVPVRQSVLAPAEVVPRAPVMVRAPIQGVVDSVAVQPNQEVKAGQLLLTLDARELESQLESAKQALAVATAEWRQGQQLALRDDRSKAMLGLLQGKYDQAAADAAYLTQALARSRIQAERDGIVIFDDPNDWIGKPVALGERMMMLADPQDAQLEIMLPVADAIALEPQAPVRFFMNIAPTSPKNASLLRMGYRAAPMPDGIMAYRAKAVFDEGTELPRIGLKGTAKLYGQRTVLFLYLMRRPLASLRAWLGW